MSENKVVILDGAFSDDSSLSPVLAILADLLKSSGDEVKILPLRQMRFGHCTGCFGCWLQTPGECVASDAGREIARAIVRSDMTILLTPISFGGYSSLLKKICDRWVPLSLPYFTKCFGETHHQPRYTDFPRLVGIGVQSLPNSREARIFKIVVGRNAINFHARSHAADVIDDRDDPIAIRLRFQALLKRVDSLPLRGVLTSLMPAPDTLSSSHALNDSPRALLIVGSPKTGSSSTSGVLGNYLLERLRAGGWQIEALTLRTKYFRGMGQHELLSAVDRADLILLAFPLYIDALPFLVTKMLEDIAAHRRQAQQARPQRLAVICNNGFPEAHQNIPALAICHQFAVQSGIGWAGSLAMGAGEALCSGQALTGAVRTGRPPVKHVIQALEITGAALAAGDPIPGKAARLMSKSPIPFLTFSLWRWIYLKFGVQNWHRLAAENGVSRYKLRDRPYIA